MLLGLSLLGAQAPVALKVGRGCSSFFYFLFPIFFIFILYIFLGGVVTLPLLLACCCCCCCCCRLRCSPLPHTHAHSHALSRRSLYPLATVIVIQAVHSLVSLFRSAHFLPADSLSSIIIVIINLASRLPVTFFTTGCMALPTKSFHVERYLYLRYLNRSFTPLPSTHNLSHHRNIHARYTD